MDNLYTVLKRAAFPLVVILGSLILQFVEGVDYKFVQLVTVIGLVLLFIRLLDLFYFSGQMGHRREYELPKLFKGLMVVIIWIFAGIAWLAFNVKDISSHVGFFTTSSVMIAIIGFAVRNLVADFFSGITLGLEMPFRIGDWIEPEPGIVGKVMEMNWRSTKIVTKENISIVIPNSQLSNISFRNYNLPALPFRTSFEVTLDYDVTAYQVQRVLLSAANEIPEIRNSYKQPDLIVKEFSSHGVVWELRFWLDDYYKKDSLTLAIQKNILRNFHYSNISVSAEKISINRPVHNQEVEDVVQMLSKVNIFESLAQEDIEFLSEHAVERVFKAGQYVIYEGDEGDSMFMVAEGLLTVFVNKEDTSLLEVATLRSGNFFGEAALVTGEKRTSTVQAVVDSMLYEIPKTAMKELLNNHKYLIKKLSKAVAKRQVSSYRKVIKVEKEEERQSVLDKATQSNFEKILKFFNLKC